MVEAIIRLFSVELFVSLPPPPTRNPPIQANAQARGHAELQHGDAEPAPREATSYVGGAAAGGSGAAG